MQSQKYISDIDLKEFFKHNAVLHGSWGATSLDHVIISCHNYIFSLANIWAHSSSCSPQASLKYDKSHLLLLDPLVIWWDILLTWLFVNMMRDLLSSDPRLIWTVSKFSKILCTGIELENEDCPGEIFFHYKQIY